jgi:hypothetical protein
LGAAGTPRFALAHHTNEAARAAVPRTGSVVADGDLPLRISISSSKH